MNSCTFIGHRNCPEEVKDKLYNVIEKLISEKNVTIFYVGNHGKFDRFVYNTLIKLEEKYMIQINVVLAYINIKRENQYFDSKKTIFPEILEKTPFKYAIIKRNLFMIESSKYMVSYINNTFSNTYSYVMKAKENKLNIINLGELDLDNI